jgi:hypothetical protein
MPKGIGEENWVFARVQPGLHAPGSEIRPSITPLSMVKELPPEDQPDTFSIGPVGPIPIIHDDDPRFAEDRAAWSAARRKAQAMHSADELVRGIGDPEWRVRHEVVDRLIARASDDSRQPTVNGE